MHCNARITSCNVTVTYQNSWFEARNVIGFGNFEESTLRAIKWYQENKWVWTFLTLHCMTSISIGSFPVSNTTLHDQYFNWVYSSFWCYIAWPVFQLGLFQFLMLHCMTSISTGSIPVSNTTLHDQYFNWIYSNFLVWFQCRPLVSWRDVFIVQTSETFKSSKFIVILPSTYLSQLIGWACPPQGSQFFHFDIKNFQNVTTSGVHAPPWGPRPYLKSWIHHCNW